MPCNVISNSHLQSGWTHRHRRAGSAAAATSPLQPLQRNFTPFASQPGLPGLPSNTVPFSYGTRILELASLGIFRGAIHPSGLTDLCQVMTRQYLRTTESSVAPSVVDVDCSQIKIQDC